MPQELIVERYVHIFRGWMWVEPRVHGFLIAVEPFYLRTQVKIYPTIFFDSPTTTAFSVPEAFYFPALPLSLFYSASDKNRAGNYIRSRVNPDEVRKRVEITSKCSVTLHEVEELPTHISTFVQSSLHNFG